MRPHQRRVEWENHRIIEQFAFQGTFKRPRAFGRVNHLPRPSGDAEADAPQYVVGPFGYQDTLLTHIQLAIDLNPQIVLCRAGFNLSCPNLYLQ